MKFSSIKTKLLVILLVSIVFSFTILGLYNAKNAYEFKYNLVKNNELFIVKETGKYINDYLKSKINIVKAASAEIENKNLVVENKVLVDKLMLAKKAGEFPNFYIGLNNSGDLIKYDGSSKTIAKNNYDARLRPWYKKALEIQKEGIAEPFISNTSKKLVITAFVPYKRNNQLVGVLGANVYLDTIVKQILNIKLDGKGAAYLVSDKGSILIHKNKKLFKKKSTVFQRIKTNENTRFVELNDNGVEKLVAYNKIPLSSWYLVVEIEKASAFKSIKKDILQVIFIYVGLLIAILLFIYIVLKNLLNPIDKLNNGLKNFFQYLKGEKTKVESININTNDEFGEMAKKIDLEIEVVRKGLDEDRALIENVKTVVAKIKNGNLNVTINKDTSNASLNELKNILNEMIDAVSSNVHNDINVILEALEKYSKLNFEENIENSSGKVSNGLNDLCNIINQMLQENYKLGEILQNNAKQLLSNVDSLNRSSNETAASLEETSASIEEITTTIIETTSNIAKMSSYSNNLLNSIKEGQDLANVTVASMDEINDQTQSIADAITVIDQIAFQTNILSLNAAVEAATAGEAGKGFAVVAQEVRNLASRSAEAAKEIKELVENATQKTNAGKINADKMIEGYITLNDNINKTTEIIKHIEKASNEQKIGMEQINDAVTSLDSRTQQNANVANEAHNIAVNTSSIADNILEDVNKKKFRKS